jgi:hypothetical protein
MSKFVGRPLAHNRRTISYSLGFVVLSAPKGHRGGRDARHTARVLDHGVTVRPRTLRR